MTFKFVSLPDEASCLGLVGKTDDRIYEFNVAATGYSDGQLFAFAISNEAGETIAGINGHTWGGCCEVTNLWVHEGHRGSGLGSTLMQSAEAEAVRRGCERMTLLTHSFQAPQFYERLGFVRTHEIAGRPRGYSDIVFEKTIR